MRRVHSKEYGGAPGEMIELSVGGHWEIKASALLQYKETVDLNSKSHHQK